MAEQTTQPRKAVRVMGEHRCDTCLNSRVIISENGYHSICCLSQKKAVDCITKQKDYYAKNPSTRTPKERGGVREQM